MDSDMSAPKARTKKQYCEDNMTQAIGDVKSDLMSAYAASKKYNVPVSTLRDRIKGVHNKAYGSEKVLSDEEEALLAEWIILCARAGFPKSKKQILKTAAQVANLHPTKTFLRGTPTSGWFKKFSKRHPEISKRTPELLGKASAAVTVKGLETFFNLVKSQFEEAGRADLLNKPESWWNIDETGFEMNPKPESVYAKKGAKTVHLVERGKTKENITCTYAVSANGEYVPPLITFKETFSNLDLAAYVSKDVRANFGFNHTESGWMKSDSFYYYVTEHLYPRWCEMGLEFPIVLVIDGYAAHKDPKLYLWCTQHDIILLLLYPNSTHIIQVLDICIFGPLKKKYDEFYEEWTTINPNENFTELEFIKVLKVTNDAVLKPKTIINGWRASGLQPFNFSNVNVEKLITNDSTNHHDQTPQNVSATIPFASVPVNINVDRTPQDCAADPTTSVPIKINIELVSNDSTNRQVQTLDDDFAEGEYDLCDGVLIQCEDRNDLGDEVGTDGEREFDLCDGTPIQLGDQIDTYNHVETETEHLDPTNSHQHIDVNGSASTTSFSALHKNIGLFANDFNDMFDDRSFGLGGNKNFGPDISPTSETSKKKLTKLVEKARQSIHQLGMYVKVVDPSKMLNILVMAQQLNIIDPVAPEVEIVPPQTPQDILKVPTITRKTKLARNKKLSFGVMSDVEIVETIEELVEGEKAEDREVEADKLAEIERANEIELLEKLIEEEKKNMQDKKQQLQSLKAQKSNEKRELSAKRKLAGDNKKKQRNAKQLKGASQTGSSGPLQNRPKTTKN